MVGPDTGIGLNLGAGWSQSKMKGWSNPGNLETIGFSSDEGQFRFSNDLGGNVTRAKTNNALSASVTPVTGLQLDQDDLNSYNEADETTSSHIEFQKRDDYLNDDERFDKVNQPSVSSGDLEESTICAYRVTIC